MKPYLDDKSTNAVVSSESVVSELMLPFNHEQDPYFSSSPWPAARTMDMVWVPLAP